MRVLPPAALDRVRAHVAASETRHTGQIRICIEGGMPLSYLLRHLRRRIPLQTLARQRALMMFSKLRVWDTERNNGVLIYLLLSERRIDIVADRGLAAATSAVEWGETVDRLGAALASGHYEAGLTQAIDETSARLIHAFPRAAIDASDNELPDDPVVL